MLSGSKRHGGGVLVLIAVVALAASACGSSLATPTAGATTAQTSGPADTSGPTATGDQGGTSMSGAAANLADVTSYKFTMTLAGSPFDALLTAFGDTGGDNVPFTISGTIVNSPEAGTDAKSAARHIIEIGGFDYMEQDDGSYVQTQISGSGLISSFTPQALYSGSIDASADNGFSVVGTETKNGVQADHYQASTAYLAQFGSILGIANATWSADAWIATDGGYPVSIAIVAKAADKSVVYQMSFDLTNVNDAANKVVAPTNIAGA
jgi:hypothetical protein